MSEPLNILLVEDDADALDFMETLLTDLGHQVTIGRDGLEALDLAKAPPRPFDLVMMDMQMPRMDGIEAVRHLRLQPTTAEVPSLCISAKASGTTREQGLEAGCDLFMTKPAWEEEILDAMRTVLRMRGRSSPEDPGP